MFYKGREIEDHEYVNNSQLLTSLYENNSQVFTLEDIETWKELIINKTEELKSNGVDFKNVAIEITADGYHYNPNGADDEPYMDVSIQWQELETDERREKRIERNKKRIDEEIEHDKGIEEAKTHLNVPLRMDGLSIQQSYSKRGIIMTNEEKEKGIAQKWYHDNAPNMAEWKDEKFYKVLTCIKISIESQGFCADKFVEEIKKNNGRNKFMTKEDYMKLSKERLAELLAERDAANVRIEPIIIEGASGIIPCYAPGGICTNPQRDCIGCPKRHIYGGSGYYTTTNTWINDGKD